MPVTEREMKIDTAMSQHAKQKIVCILLQYAATAEIREGTLEKGLIVYEAVEKMRAELADNYKRIEEAVGKQAIVSSCERIEFDRIIYSQVNDPALESNRKAFKMPARPDKLGYQCSEDLCDRATLAILQEYFPSLYVS